MSANQDRIRRLLQAAPRSADHLLDLLLNGLDWPIPDGLAWGDIELEWEPEEFHLDPEKVAKLKQISQIPPLTKNQSFGVFVLDFEGGRLPVGAIRRLVQRLVRNERARKGSGTHAQWSLNDLLFFCLSEGPESLLHVVNFREKNGKRVLRVMSWSDQLTNSRLDLLVRRGVPDLFWSPVDGPQMVSSPDFGKSFRGYREGIKSAAALSRRMAEVAQDVRDEVRTLYEVETMDGPIRALFSDVRDQLLGNLTPSRFADVYAQTMVYGLLTARIAHPEEFKVEQSVSALRFDNEFLDAIYSRFRDDSDGIIDVDELGLNELAEELAATDVDELLADFGADNQRDDPVVYFYEEFLAQYDPDQRRDLGAFYTPLPVVRYIVTTVDDALKSFGLPLGVADSTTWAEYVEAHPEIEIPKRANPDDSVVSMFDPANGTGTFLVEWVRQARRNAGDAGEAAALAHASACEISLASYAVSHLKVSLDISEALRDKVRLPIYLGDTLGQKHPHVIEELADPISIEGAHADEVKYDWNHSVLIGNPPYDRVESTGTGGFVTALQHGSSRSLFDDIFDDAKRHTIFSHHASLYNLYVYFWRWAIWKVFEESTGPAVVSMITASSWLAGPGFLGLRRLAREVADEIVVVDLHGDNKGTRKDENVFDIESPVAIVTLVRRGNGDRTMPAAVRYASYRGTRVDKLDALKDLANGMARLETTGASADWHAPLVPSLGGMDWQSYVPLIDLLPWQSPGCKFNRTWPIAPDSELLNSRWQRLMAGPDEADRALCFVTPSSGRNIWSRVGELKRITVERLFAYTFGILAGADYTARFHEALGTPGPRVPVTADVDLFDRMVGHGEKLIWLQTFGERFGQGSLPTAGAKWESEPTRPPEARSEIIYSRGTETLRIADGVLTGVPADVWKFQVSGMEVIPKWLGYRMGKPPGKAASSKSALDKIRPITWSTEWSNELIEIVSAIKGTLALLPDGIALLDEIVAGPIIPADELPSVPPALRQPPKAGKASAEEDTLLFEDGMLPGTQGEVIF